jgi:hypothetical protein
MLDVKDPIQGYGKFDIKEVELLQLDFTRIQKVTKFSFNEMTVNLQLRVSFFDSSLDTQASPIIFSQEVCVPGNS